MQRMTRQRTAVAQVLDASTGFRSAQQIHESLRDAGHSVGLATVYRTLQSLADNGDVDVLRSADGENLFRQCERQSHHHHLVCRSCGHTVDIDGPTVESWAASVGAQYGFSDIQHTVEIFGICAKCQASS